MAAAQELRGWETKRRRGRERKKKTRRTEKGNYRS